MVSRGVGEVINRLEKDRFVQAVMEVVWGLSVERVGIAVMWQRWR